MDSGYVILDNVRVTGRLLARGGGENSIIIKGNSNIENILASKVEGKMRIKLEESNIKNIELDCEDDIIIEGDFDNLLILGNGIQIDTINSKIGKAIIEGKNNKLNLGKNCKITAMELDKKAEKIELVLEENGEIDLLEINSEDTIIGGVGKIGYIKNNSKNLKSYLVNQKSEKKEKSSRRDRDRSEKIEEKPEIPEEEEENPIEPETPNKPIEPENPEEEDDSKDSETTEGEIGTPEEEDKDENEEIEQEGEDSKDSETTEGETEAPEDGGETKYEIIAENIKCKELTTGEKLSDSILSGTFKNGKEEIVEGELIWENRDQKINDSGNYNWIFKPSDGKRYDEIRGDVYLQVNPVIVSNYIEFAEAINEGKKYIKLKKDIIFNNNYKVKRLDYNIDNGEIDLNCRELKVEKNKFNILGDGIKIKNGSIKTNKENSYALTINGKDTLLEGVKIESGVRIIGLEYDSSSFKFDKPKEASLTIKSSHIRSNTNKNYNLIRIEGIKGKASVIVKDGGSLTTNGKYAFHIVKSEGNSVII